MRWLAQIKRLADLHRTGITPHTRCVLATPNREGLPFACLLTLAHRSPGVNTTFQSSTVPTFVPFHIPAAQTLSLAVAVTAVLWHDAVDAADLPTTHAGVVGFTALLCGLTVADLLSACLQQRGRRSSAEEQRPWMSASYAASVCGLADSLSTLAVLAGHVQIFAVAVSSSSSSSASSSSCLVLSPDNVTTDRWSESWWLALSTQFAYASCSAGATEGAGMMLVQLVLATMSSFKVVKILVKLWIPVVEGWFPCCCRTNTTMQVLGGSHRRPRQAGPTAIAEDQSHTEHRLGDNLNKHFTAAT